MLYNNYLLRWWSKQKQYRYGNVQKNVPTNTFSFDGDENSTCWMIIRSRVTHALNSVNQFPLLLQLVLSDLMDVWRNCFEPVK